jgi:hypothetical protein
VPRTGGKKIFRYVTKFRKSPMEQRAFDLCFLIILLIIILVGGILPV